MKKIVEFFEKRFIFLLVASLLLLISTIVVFAIVGDGVSTEKSIEQVKRKVEKDGLLKWHFGSSGEIIVMLNDEGDLIFNGADSQRVYSYNLKTKVISVIETISSDDFGWFKIEANYVYRHGKGNSTMSNPWGYMEYDNPTWDIGPYGKSKTSAPFWAKDFGDTIAFCMGGNTSSALPALFITLIILSSLCVTATVLSKFVLSRIFRKQNLNSEKELNQQN